MNLTIHRVFKYEVSKYMNLRHGSPEANHKITRHGGIIIEF